MRWVDTQRYKDEAPLGLTSPSSMRIAKLAPPANLRPTVPSMNRGILHGNMIFLHRISKQTRRDLIVGQLGQDTRLERRLPNKRDDRLLSSGAFTRLQASAPLGLGFSVVYEHR